MIEIRKCDQLVQIYVIKKEQLSNILEMKNKFKQFKTNQPQCKLTERESQICVLILLLRLQTF